MANQDVTDPIALLRSLVAVREFTDQALPPVVIKDIQEVVRWSGNASNRQEFQVLWIEDRDKLRRLSELKGHARHLAGAAAGAVIVTWMNRDELNAFDEGRIAERIMLAALVHGVSSCIGMLQAEGREAAKKLLDVPSDRMLRTMVSLGYAAEGAHRGKRRKPLAELVRRID